MSDLTERQRALIIADDILNRPNADPDDDLAILARQLLRAGPPVDALRAEPPRSFPDPAREMLLDVRAGIEGIDVGPWRRTRRIRDEALTVIDEALRSRLGSSPDLTGLDPLTLAAAMPGLSFDYDGHRVYLALYQPDLTGDAIVSAEMGYWLRAARALAARLSPAPETDPSQVER